jgi:hypothetical protein
MSARNGPERAIFLVSPREDGWAVEHGGEVSGFRGSKEEAKATANKMARASQDAGRPCQVRVSGEHGFFTAP